MNVKKNNLFAGIPQALLRERFDALVETDGIKLERIVSEGQATPAGEWLSQERDEWVIVLAGRARLIFEGETAVVEMLSGDYVHITAGIRHRVDWTDPQEKTVWLALYFKDS